MVRCITCNVLHMRNFCRFLHCLARFDTVEFNRLLCPDKEMYHNAVFADRFRYQLAMFGNRVLIWLSWLLHAHIAYITDGAKIIAAFCEFPIVCMILYGWIQCRRCSNNKMYDDVGFDDRFRYQLTMYEVCILIPWYTYCMWNSYMKNHHW